MPRMNEKAHAVPRVRRVAAIHVCALCALPFVRVALSRVARSIREDTERRAGERALVAVIERWHVSQLRKLVRYDRLLIFHLRYLVHPLFQNDEQRKHVCHRKDLPPEQYPEFEVISPLSRMCSEYSRGWTSLAQQLAFLPFLQRPVLAKQDAELHSEAFIVPT
jgi:hypothetical protein